MYIHISLIQFRLLKERTAYKAEQIDKMTTIFTQNGLRLGCGFE